MAVCSQYLNIAYQEMRVLYIYWTRACIIGDKGDARMEVRITMRWEWGLARRHTTRWERELYYKEDRVRLGYIQVLRAVLVPLDWRYLRCNLKVTRGVWESASAHALFLPSSGAQVFQMVCSSRACTTGSDGLDVGSDRGNPWVWFPIPLPLPMNTIPIG